ncbi:hypothetical protein RFI_10768, partial [Reticulomyxa filosa]
GKFYACVLFCEQTTSNRTKQQKVNEHLVPCTSRYHQFSVISTTSKATSDKSKKTNITTKSGASEIKPIPISLSTLSSGSWQPRTLTLDKQPFSLPPLLAKTIEGTCGVTIRQNRVPNHDNRVYYDIEMTGIATAIKNAMQYYIFYSKFSVSLTLQTPIPDEVVNSIATDFQCFVQMDHPYLRGFFFFFWKLGYTTEKKGLNFFEKDLCLSKKKKKDNSMMTNVPLEYPFNTKNVAEYLMAMLLSVRKAIESMGNGTFWFATSESEIDNISKHTRPTLWIYQKPLSPKAGTESTTVDIVRLLQGFFTNIKQQSRVYPLNALFNELLQTPDSRLVFANAKTASLWCVDAKDDVSDGILKDLATVAGSVLPNESTSDIANVSLSKQYLSTSMDSAQTLDVSHRLDQFASFLQQCNRVAYDIIAIEIPEAKKTKEKMKQLISFLRLQCTTYHVPRFVIDTNSMPLLDSDRPNLKNVIMMYESDPTKRTEISAKILQLFEVFFFICFVSTTQNTWIKLQFIYRLLQQFEKTKFMQLMFSCSLNEEEKYLEISPLFTPNNFDFDTFSKTSQSVTFSKSKDYVVDLFQNTKVLTLSPPVKSYLQSYNTLTRDEIKEKQSTVSAQVKTFLQDHYKAVIDIDENEWKDNVVICASDLSTRDTLISLLSQMTETYIKVPAILQYLYQPLEMKEKLLEWHKKYGLLDFVSATQTKETNIEYCLILQSSNTIDNVKLIEQEIVKQSEVFLSSLFFPLSTFNLHFLSTLSPNCQKIKKQKCRVFVGTMSSLLKHLSLFNDDTAGYYYNKCYYSPLPQILEELQNKLKELSLHVSSVSIKQYYITVMRIRSNLDILMNMTKQARDDGKCFIWFTEEPYNCLHIYTEDAELRKKFVSQVDQIMKNSRFVDIPRNVDFSRASRIAKMIALKYEIQIGISKKNISVYITIMTKQ